MKAVVQRSLAASVTVDGHTAGRISSGLVVFVGVESADTVADAVACAHKIVDLRIFADEDGKMNRSIAEVHGAVLVVSQFTLAARVRKGRRPSFVGAARPEDAEPLIEQFCATVASRGLVVEQGVFGAHMLIELVNDGPVTLLVETKDGSII
ncbi:MAG: D-aminoacyl-tRNA deacylase [Acidimicrobiia bacterium]